MFLSHYISEDYAQRIPELIQLIQHRCFEVYGQLADYQVAENTYIKLLNSLDWRSSLVSLFTTNYDPVTDSLMEYAENFSVPVYDGFRFISGKWDPARYSEVTTGLTIYRLRGSLSWIREGEKIRNTRFYGQTKDRDHVLIYPGRSPGPQAMEDCIGYPHEALADKLLNAKNLIVIGYSFRDSFVNEILRTAMHRNADLKIVVVDPERPERIDTELKTGDLSETERIVHVDTSFEQAVSDRSFRELIAPVKVFRAGEYPEDV